jgi:hypothetical protein
MVGGAAYRNVNGALHLKKKRHSPGLGMFRRAAAVVLLVKLGSLLDRFCFLKADSY